MLASLNLIQSEAASSSTTSSTFNEVAIATDTVIDRSFLKVELWKDYRCEILWKLSTINAMYYGLKSALGCLNLDDETESFPYA